MKISIPQPCHENWQNITAVEKGRFCGACQKKVHDFTKLSDRAILEAYAGDSTICGRFLPSQLDRELSSEKGNNKNWMATAASVLLISSVAATQAYAQDATHIEQHIDRENVIVGEPAVIETITVSGTVLDEDGLPFPGCNIGITNNPKAATTDLDGHFSITVQKGAAILVSNVGYSDATVVAIDERPLKVRLEAEPYKGKMTVVTMGMGVVIKKRTFFGRIFHSIGSLFH